MMKGKNASTKALPTSKVHISTSSMVSQTQYLSIKVQPPRAPCWQDFIGKNLSLKDSNVTSVVSSSSDQKSKGHRSKQKKSTSLKSRDVLSNSALTKLKRTRSEPYIAEKEIPVEAQQVRLTSERLSKQSIDEAKKYLEDTYYKCSQWLAQISPGSSIPLDDTEFEVGSGDIITCADETHKDIVDYHSKRHSLALDKIPE
ncbi:hypothetical protein EB796_020956 [Bugula neritina]|uniref:Uncharacterized protein n=1 Tax=Bugula neritina TaxID=10212 RepID=A0A7J7J4X1_BUGNE|nr:hypothetical protein EB796_020956 [Bugula neritina]